MANAPSSDSKVNARVIVAAVLAALAVTFIFQNAGTARVHLLFWTLSLPGWIWLLLIFLAGVAVGSIFPWLRRKKKS